MSATQGRTRTNYFAVTDKEAFREMITQLTTSEGEPVAMMENHTGSQVAFCCEDLIIGLKNTDSAEEEYEDELETRMIHRIQELLVPGHACIISDICWDNLRTVNGGALIITKDNYQGFNMNDFALNLAKNMLGDQNYCPSMTY